MIDDLGSNVYSNQYSTTIVKTDEHVIVNILNDIVYIAPQDNLPVPDGMCVNCAEEK